MFVSYAGTDRAYVRGLAAEATKRGVAIWFDQDIRSGASWAQVIERHVRTCAAFVPILTPASHRSKWCQRELLLADQLGKPKFPLLLRPSPIPFTIIDAQYDDVRGGRLPADRWFRLLASAVRTAAAGATPATTTAARPPTRSSPTGGATPAAPRQSPPRALDPPAQKTMWSRFADWFLSDEGDPPAHKAPVPTGTAPAGVSNRLELRMALRGIEARFARRDPLSADEAFQLARRLWQLTREDVLTSVQATELDREAARRAVAALRGRPEVPPNVKQKFANVRDPRPPR